MWVWYPVGELRSHMPQGNYAYAPQLKKPMHCNEDPVQPILSKPKTGSNLSLLGGYISVGASIPMRERKTIDIILSQ